MNCFEKLGLASSATKAEVKAAWKSKVFSLHPDRGGDVNEFIEYREAYTKALKLATQDNQCDLCHGKGVVKVIGGWNALTLPCSLCGGTGISK